MIEEEKFFAWLDGELSPEEASRVKAAVAADPELSRKADEHRAMAAGLRGAFASVADAPLPESIAAAVRPDNVLDFAQGRRSRDARQVPLWVQMAALAATLAVGIFTGNVLLQAPSGPVQVEGGRLVAGGALENALYASLASAPSNQGPRIGMTYREKSGAICRTFTEGNSSGLACREGGDWRIRGLFEDGAGESSEYRMASGPDQRLMDMVEKSIAGEPFDAAQERAALQRGWQ